jgi:hypothetical protein
MSCDTALHKNHCSCKQAFTVTASNLPANLQKYVFGRLKSWGKYMPLCTYVIDDFWPTCTYVTDNYICTYRPKNGFHPQ